MKNRLLKLSRKGKISAIAWWLYSDSEMISPAMNAPSARDRPASELSQAMPRHTRMMVITNSSRLRLRTTSINKRGTRYRAATRISSTARAALVTDHRTARSPASPRPPNTGVKTIIGTTARSCTIKTPMISRPCGELVSPRSVTILSTTAVLLIAARKPQNTPWLSGSPKAIAASADRTIAEPIWRSPAPATVRVDRGRVRVQQAPAPRRRRLPRRGRAAGPLWAGRRGQRGPRGGLRRGGRRAVAVHHRGRVFPGPTPVAAHGRRRRAPPDRLRDRPVCAGGDRLRAAAQPGRVLGLPGGDEQHGGRAQDGDGAGRDQLSARPADHRGLDRAGPGGGADDGLDAGVGGARGGRTSGGPVVGRQGSPGGAADSRGGAVPGL